MTNLFTQEEKNTDNIFTLHNNKMDDYDGNLPNFTAIQFNEIIQTDNSFLFNIQC
jgi:hypothetical protein